MPELLPLFLAGLLGGTHCVAMCGGVVAVLAGSPITVSARVGRPGVAGRLPLLLSYNAGRIASYVLVGAIAGGLGFAGANLAGQLPARLVLLLLANLLLVAMGLYLMGIPQLLLPLERGGAVLWRRLQPATRRFLPARTPLQAFPLGLIWGWLPCGLVYSALASALASGSAERGAMVMLAFGLGTLPNLLFAGLFAAGLVTFVKRSPVRIVSGVVVAGFGLYGLLGAARIARASGVL